MDCIECNANNIISAKYICTESDYRLIRTDDTLIKIIDDHNLTDSEIGEFSDVYYCTNGHFTDQSDYI